MTILTQGKRTAEFLLSEANGQRSREEVMLAITAAALPPGQVLGVVTATGECAPYAPGASDGTETAVAVLYAGAPVSAATQRATVIARDAEVIGSQLTGLDAAARDDLLAKGIVVR